MEQKICPVCGKTFLTRFDNKYCSARCKRDDICIGKYPEEFDFAVRRLTVVAPHRKYKKFCPVCGAEFIGVGQAIYCSKRCKRVAYRRRKRGAL